MKERRLRAAQGSLPPEELACLRAIEAEHARYLRLKRPPRPKGPSPIGPNTFEDEKVRANLEALADYRRSHGHVRVPTRGKEDPHTVLANWVRRMRRAHREGMLPEWVRRDLEALGFEWAVPPGFYEPPRWEALFDRLRAYQREHGDCLVPIRIPADRALTQWVRFQRVRAREGRLEAERRRRLEEVGFAFSARDAIWERHYRRLVAFKKAHGHCDVLFREPTKLGVWVRNQRVARQQKVLREDRVRRLEALGISWELRRPVDVDARLEALARFRAEHGHLAIPQHRGMDALHAWARGLRVKHAAGTLSGSVRLRLEALGFPFEDEEVAWEYAFAGVKAHLGRRGGLPREGTRLGRWLLAQRVLWRGGNLEPDRERRLAGLGIAPPDSGRVRRGG